MMVYAVSRWLNESRNREVIPWSTIEKEPSAELRPDQKDQDSLPPYPQLDAILERYVERFEAVDDIVAAGFEEETVRWVTRRVDLNEWKRQQAAPGISCHHQGLRGREANSHRSAVSPVNGRPDCGAGKRLRDSGDGSMIRR